MVGGPYRRLVHPVYLGNLLVAFGLLIAARPPGALAAALAGALVLFYAALARREQGQLSGLPQRRIPAAGPLQVARSERSTWIVVCLFLLLATL